MKRIVCSLLALSLYTAAFAQPITTAQPSPTQTLKQNFGLSSIELSYSRPGLKGRTVGGEVAPFGAVWRTGANTATTLTFGEEVMIGNKKIPAGKYGLLSIPGKEEWTLIITKQLDVTAPEAYKVENDVVRVSVKPTKLNDKVETFTIQFTNIKPDSCDLQLAWANTQVMLPITTETDKRIMSQIDNLLNKDTKPYYNAAMYYVDNGKDLNQAVSWFDKAIAQNPKNFTAYYQKARALNTLGKKDEAKKAANRSLELATEAKNNNYIDLNKKLLSTI